MDAKAHWEQVYRDKLPQETSWFAPHLETSLDWIVLASGDRSARIFDVGGGESTLVDDLLAAGYRSILVLDLAGSAIGKARQRLGPAADSVDWAVGDATSFAFPPRSCDVWHDRAVFHFLTEAEDRAAYRRNLVSALRPGGSVVLATFGPHGPVKCSGLPTRRYDAAELSREMGARFQLERSAIVNHQTPFGGAQEFLYCLFRFQA
jgi:SAM-dependent methyltransferase